MDKNNKDYIDQKQARILRLAVEAFIAKQANPALSEALGKEKSLQVLAKHSILAAQVFVEEWEKTYASV